MVTCPKRDGLLHDFVIEVVALSRISRICYGELLMVPVIESLVAP